MVKIYLNIPVLDKIIINYLLDYCWLKDKCDIKNCDKIHCYHFECSSSKCNKK